MSPRQPAKRKLAKRKPAKRNRKRLKEGIHLTTKAKAHRVWDTAGRGDSAEEEGASVEPGQLGSGVSRRAISSLPESISLTQVSASIFSTAIVHLQTQHWAPASYARLTPFSRSLSLLCRLGIDRRLGTLAAATKKAALPLADRALPRRGVPWLIRMLASPPPPTTQPL